jgi:hypothetical protein
MISREKQPSIMARKINLIFLCLLLTGNSIGQITIDYVYSFDDCNSSRYVNFGYTDLNNNPPYTAKIFFPGSDYTLDSTIFSSNTGNVDFVQYGMTFMPYRIMIISSLGDSAETYAYPDYNSMSVLMSDNTYYDGTVTVSASYGTPPYIYHLYNFDNYVATQNTPTFYGLPLGAYEVFVEDAADCGAWNTVLIASGGITACTQNMTTIVENETCFDACNGYIIWNLLLSVPDSAYTMITKGPNNYYDSLVIMPGVTSGVLTNLCQGIYEIYTHTDINCIDTAQFLVDGPISSLDLNLDNFLIPSVGNSDGALYYSAIGGIAPYSFSLNDGPLQGNGNFINLPMGSYSIKVVDSSGCSYTTSFVLEDDLSLADENSQLIQLYPNPAHGATTIKTHEHYTYDLLDTKGNLIFSGDIHGTKTLNLSDLPNGIYFIRLMNTSKVYLKKVIVY